MQLLVPHRFRFVDDDDVKAYGDGWRVWDEDALVRQMRGHELIELENTLGMPLRAVMVGVRRSSVIGFMAAMWIVLHRDGHEVAWEDFNPMVGICPWEVVPPAAPLGEHPGPDSEEAPPQPTTSSDPSKPSEESATSS